MIVSIHIPKAAGTSFNLSLKQHFGSALRQDYLDRPFGREETIGRKTHALMKALELTPGEFQGIECVHGHFLACKYRLLAEQMPCSFVTWLRNPVERLISHYYYWIESFDPNTCLGLHKKCVEEEWSFKRFSLCEEFKDMQSQLLWCVPLDSIEFVGITEFYAQDFARFSRRYLGAEFEQIRTNETRTKPRGECLDPGLRRDIEQFHAQDVALYRAALDRRSREIHSRSISSHAAVEFQNPALKTAI